MRAETGTETQRLFFALWPTAEVRAGIGALRDGFVGLSGRPVVLEQIHQTLLFVGETNDDQRLYLEAMAGDLTAPPFTLNLDRLGYWPKPEIYWLGASDTPTPLTALVEGLRRSARVCGLRIDNRPFAVHLTLQRKVRHRPALMGLINPIAWPVGEFALVASRLRPTGPEYRIVRTWALT